MNPDKQKLKNSDSFDIILDCKRRNDSQRNQVRHRAKKKLYLEALDEGVEKLKREIRQLECSMMDFMPLLQSVKVQAAQVRLDIVEKMYVVYSAGEDIPRMMMHACMKNEIILNGALKIRQEFWNQMLLLRALYGRVYYEVRHVDVCGLNHDIIHVAATLHLQLNRSVIQTLYPMLSNQYKMVEFLIGKWMALDVHQVYTFEGHFIQTIDTNCDWLNAWRELCRNYTDVLMILNNAHIDTHLTIHLPDDQIPNL